MYEKHNWVNGEVITEDKLNHMEDGISTGGGIYTYGEVTFFDDEVTTVQEVENTAAIAEITLQGNLPKSDISVTFNGQDYTLPHGYVEGIGDYWGELAGAPSFTNFPVFVYEGGIYTQEEGTYALKIVGNSFELNDDFKNSFPKNMLVNVSERSNNYSLDKTYSEINSAVLNGDNVKFLLYDGAFTKEYYLDSISSDDGWLLNLFYVNHDPDTELNILQFSYTNSEGYPSTSGSSPHN